MLAAGLQRARRGPDAAADAARSTRALRDGTVDAMEANLGLVQTYQCYEVAKFVTANINFWPFPTVLVINKDKFDSLTRRSSRTS